MACSATAPLGPFADDNFGAHVATGPEIFRDLFLVPTGRVLVVPVVPVILKDLLGSGLSSFEEDDNAATRRFSGMPSDAATSRFAGMPSESD